MRTVKECYEAFQNGDKLEDDELKRFTMHMELTTQQLDFLGPEFKIVANHCREVARRNRSYMTNRGIN